jgi:hypothetical protein
MARLSEEMLGECEKLYEQMSALVLQSPIPMELRRRMLVRYLSKHYFAILIAERISKEEPALLSEDLDELKWLFEEAVNHELASLRARGVIGERVYSPSSEAVN